MTFLENEKIIPVVVLNRLEDTLPVLKSLKDGGIRVAEITFRTECAGEAIRLAVNTFDDMYIGAGTVINGKQCETAIDAGAQFIVSPGFSEDVCRACQSRNVPYLPGAVTATEIMNVIAHGIKLIKFFPAEAAGGIKTMKALSSAFPGITFIPTGGIGPSNIREYISQPFIAAVGGSWMLKGSPEEIKNLTAEAKQLIG